MHSSGLAAIPSSKVSKQAIQRLTVAFVSRSDLNEQSRANAPSVSVILNVRSKLEKLTGLGFSSTSNAGKFKPHRTQTMLNVVEIRGVRLRSRGSWSFCKRVPKV